MNGWLPWAAVAVFTVAYVLIATERIHRVAAALGGAGVMLALGVTDAEAAFFSEESGVDWNVVFLLLGMMVIVGVLRQTGIFEFLAVWAVKRARGRPFRVMVILVVITAFASSLLDNVTTVLLVAPVTLLVCERLGAPVVPFLIAEALASNIGGTATLVGDPPNIIIASRGGLTFNDFLAVLAPLVLGLLVVFLGLCRMLFRRAFTFNPDRADAVLRLSEREAITDPRLLAKSLIVLVAVMGAFVLHTVLHLEPSVVALLGGGVLLAISRLPVADALAEVEWPTLALLHGAVRDGRRAGPHRRDRNLVQGRRRGDRGQAVAHLDGPAVGVRGVVLDCGQHPVCGDDEPDRGRSRARSAGRWRRGSGRAVVVARARRRPRRQRHRRRRTS